MDSFRRRLALLWPLLAKPPTFWSTRPNFPGALPLAHFFLRDLPPAMAAFILASLDFCTWVKVPINCTSAVP